MSSRVLLPVLALVFAGCTGGGVPSPTAPTASAVQPSPRPTTATTAAPKSPTSSACESGGDGSFEALVLGTANIFGAGHDTAPGPGGGGAGTLPPICDLPSGSTVVTFPAATGEVTPFTGQPLMNGPGGDRRGAGGTSTDVTSHGGISGIVNRGNGMFLVGVFLSDDEPTDPAPERLDFTGEEIFSELAPEIAQTFFIGDGRGRRFLVPAGATRLFLGFADAFLYEGPPGWYGNNAGWLEVKAAVE